MKPGDLVTPIHEECDLYNDHFVEMYTITSGDKYPIGNKYTGISLLQGEIATVLEIKRVSSNFSMDKLIKILTPNGMMGWVYSHWMKVIS
jgi:hypothetical protein